jgi:hypothetical protein
MSRIRVLLADHHEEVLARVRAILGGILTLSAL